MNIGRVIVSNFRIWIWHALADLVLFASSYLIFIGELLNDSEGEMIVLLLITIIILITIVHTLIIFFLCIKNVFKKRWLKSIIYFTHTIANSFIVWFMFIPLFLALGSIGY